MAEQLKIGFKKRVAENAEEKYLFFDTETTGLPKNWNAPVDDLNNWPRLVQLAWEFYDNGVKVNTGNFIIKPEGFEIPVESSKIHGITTSRAKKEGIELKNVLLEFQKMIEQSNYLVAHNMSFDEKIIGAEFLRESMENIVSSKKTICTKEISTNFCAIPNSNGYSSYKWPKLSELHIKLFGIEFFDSHNALADVSATAKCFWEMKERGII